MLVSVCAFLSTSVCQVGSWTQPLLEHLGPPISITAHHTGALVVLSVWGWVLWCGGLLDLRSLGPGSVCFVIAVGACGLVVVRSSFWFLKKIRCLANISMQVRVCSGSTSVKM